MKFPMILLVSVLFLIFFLIPVVQSESFQTLPEAECIEPPSSITIPVWVTNIPKGCFVGISKPSGSIEEARQYALNSVVSLILQEMGAEYQLSHKSTLSGTLQHSEHTLREGLKYTASWFLRSVHQNIKKSDVQRVNGGYIYFVLVYFPPSEIGRLRKLTVGPKVSARILEDNHNQVVIEISENNGVQIILTDYELNITTKNRHASLITMFVWKVPESSQQNFKGALKHKISLKENSQKVTIPMPNPHTNLKSFILGSSDQRRIVFHGFDELGRPLSLPVNKF